MAGQHGDCILQKLALVGAYVSDSGIVGLPDGLVLSKDQLGSLKKELAAWEFPPGEWPEGRVYEDSPLEKLLTFMARDPAAAALVSKLDELARNSSRETARRYAAGIWAFCLVGHRELEGRALQNLAIDLFSELMSPDDPARRAREVWE